jgi:CheY-like chemotaxis protein
MAHILIVDDERGFRQIVHIIFKRAGYTTSLAANTAEARQQMQHHTPDAIILDDTMPGQSGGEFCRELKANPLTASIPVIMYSAGARAERDEFIAAIGADAAVKKPSMPQELLDAVKTCLDARAGV